MLGCTFCTTSQATPIRCGGTSGSGHFYDVVPVVDQVTWDAALASASSTIVNGVLGYLATITFQADKDFMVGQFGNAIRVKWLGGFQPTESPEPAGEWQWIASGPFVYTNWELTEPNNSGGLENNLTFTTAGSAPLGVWNDLNGVNPPSGFINGYVVEFVAEPSSLVLAAFGFVGVAAWGWRRRKR